MSEELNDEFAMLTSLATYLLQKEKQLNKIYQEIQIQRKIASKRNQDIIQKLEQERDDFKLKYENQLIIQQKFQQEIQNIFQQMLQNGNMDKNEQQFQVKQNYSEEQEESSSVISQIIEDHHPQINYLIKKIKIIQSKELEQKDQFEPILNEIIQQKKNKKNPKLNIITGKSRSTNGGPIFKRNLKVKQKQLQHFEQEIEIEMEKKEAPQTITTDDINEQSIEQIQTSNNEINTIDSQNKQNIEPDKTNSQIVENQSTNTEKNPTIKQEKQDEIQEKRKRGRPIVNREVCPVCHRRFRNGQVLKEHLYKSHRIKQYQNSEQIKNE